MKQTIPARMRKQLEAKTATRLAVLSGSGGVSPEAVKFLWGEIQDRTKLLSAAVKAGQRLKKGLADAAILLDAQIHFSSGADKQPGWEQLANAAADLRDLINNIQATTARTN